MKKLRYILLLGLLGGFHHANVVFGQDAHYTQSFATPLRLNPALMGANSDLKFTLGYRTQWNSIQKGYTTMSFTALYPIFMNGGKSKLDVGLNVFNESAGAFQVLDAALALGYNLEIAENHNLSVSLMGGYIQRSIDMGALSFDSQYILGSYDAANPTNELTLRNKTGVADASFGVMWFTNAPRSKTRINAYAGFSGYHMNQANESLLNGSSKLPMRFSFQGGLKIYGKNKIDISPNTRFTVQNGNMEAAVGVYADYLFSDKSKIVIGAWYRRMDAYAFVIGFDHKNFNLGYNYDMVIKPLINSIAGLSSHEITLSYKLSQLKKSKLPSFDPASPSIATSPFSSF